MIHLFCNPTKGTNNNKYFFVNNKIMYYAAKHTRIYTYDMFYYFY